MAKIYGLFGSMKGKVADVVMAVRNGEQIVRKYQPVVSNPNTTGQVESRARLKLMSQLSAVMAPVIAIPRQGAISPRNLFTKENYRLSSYADETATIALESIQLTKSVVALPAIGASVEGNTLTVGLGVPDPELSRVVYAVFAKELNNRLRFVASKVQNTAGTPGTFETTFQLSQGSRPMVVYAYGVRDNSDAARVIFGNMETPNATTVAQLVVSRTLTSADITLTETRGVTATVSTSNNN